MKIAIGFGLLGLALSTSLIGCVLPADGSTKGDPQAQSPDDDRAAIRGTGMYVTAWPATSVTWPSGATNVFVMLHNGYATDSYCTTQAPPCDAPAYGHAIVTSLYSNGAIGTAAVYQFEMGTQSRLISQIQTAFAEVATPTSNLQWNIQGGLSGPPLPPHGPGGDGEYSASDLAFANYFVSEQLTLQSDQAAYQY